MPGALYLHSQRKDFGPHSLTLSLACPVQTEMYGDMCTVVSDVTMPLRYLKPIKGKNGPYYELYYEIILTLGLTELKAEVELRYQVGRRSSSRLGAFTDLSYRV